MAVGVGQRQLRAKRSGVVFGAREHRRSGRIEQGDLRRARSDVDARVAVGGRRERDVVADIARCDPDPARVERGSGVVEQTRILVPAAAVTWSLNPLQLAVVVTLPAWAAASSAVIAAPGSRQTRSWKQSANQYCTPGVNSSSSTPTSVSSSGLGTDVIAEASSSTYWTKQPPASRRSPPAMNPGRGETSISNAAAEGSSGSPASTSM